MNEDRGIIAADHLSKWYGQVIGLNDVTLTVPVGITGLLGPNGAGKSTFLKLITGQLKPSKGQITVLGERIWQNPALYFRIGFCPEQDACYERMTGLEWLTALVRLNGVGDHAAGEMAARALELRSILSQGWAGLTPGELDPASDCLSIGEANHGKLFPRVAAVVHHGGAGTTSTAARAGAPQVIIPHNYDQFYWAHRVAQLGVGASGPLRDDITVDNLAEALREALRPEVRTRAHELAGRMELHGARIAAERLTNEFG